MQAKLKESYFGRTASRFLRTPPYVTAEPVVTTTKVEPQKGDFVVMATDGLWEFLSNDEVVGLVGAWLDKHPNALVKASSPRSSSPTSSTSASWLQSWFGQGDASKLQLPIEASGAQGADDYAKQPIRKSQKDTSSRFVVRDANAATHLVRNALGGRA